MTARISHCLILAATIAAALGGCDKIKMNSLLSPATKQDEDGEFSILLHVLSGSEHVSQAVRYKDETEKHTGWKGLFVVYKDNHSVLYWGKYTTLEQAAKNLKKAKAYVAPAGIKLYAKAITVRLKGKDIGPPEWNLAKVKGEYSVLVALFYDVPEAKYYGRKANAVAYCRQLREKGEEAYFLHGLSQSKVTVGLFPASAVRMVTRGDVVRQQIIDGRVDVIIRRFGQLAINGYSERRAVINPKTGEVERVFVKPYPVRIPRKKGTAHNDSFDRVGNQQSW